MTTHSERVDEHCGYTPANCPWGDACADCRPTARRSRTPLTAKGMREEFVVLHAPGWPGGITPHPNTLENSERFVEKHGGVLRSRFVSDWEER